jgi:hypothetical protein
MDLFRRLEQEPHFLDLPLNSGLHPTFPDPDEVVIESQDLGFDTFPGPLDFSVTPLLSRVLPLAQVLSGSLRQIHRASEDVLKKDSVLAAVFAESAEVLCTNGLLR